MPLPKDLSLRTILIFAYALMAASLAQAQTDMKATATAIGCLAADKLQAAEQAYTAHDRSRMDQLGCFPISTGALARRIDGDMAGSVWHMRLEPDGPTPMDIWARPSSFR
jgi:hypothetical protein